MRIFGPAGPAPDISRAWRSATVHRRPSRASRRRWPFWAWCCPSVDFLLLFGAADTAQRRSASVARSCRSRRRTCAEGTTGHQPNLGFCLLVSQQTLALYFFFAFFCASSFFLLAPRNRCRSRWHSIGLPSCPSAVVVYLLHARGEAQHRQTECQRPGPTRRLLFLGPRQDEAAKYLSVNFTRRPVPRGSFRGLLARRTTH